MTGHARQRLTERFKMSPNYFISGYTEAVKKGNSFKKEYQNEKYPESIAVCMKIRTAIMIVVLNKRTGNILTFMKPQPQDMDRAIKLGW